MSCYLNNLRNLLADRALPRAICYTSIAMLAFAGNSVLCPIALKRKSVRAAD